jgi:hypothetical protein
MGRRPRCFRGAAGAVLLLAAPCGCESDRPVVPAGVTSAQPHASAPPLDRLAPGELAPGTARAFGLLLPRDLRVEAQFLKETRATGDVSPEALANYVRQRVTPARVELGAARTVFLDTLIQGGPPNHVFEIEVVPDRGGRTLLVVRDVTREPAPEGLSDAERWRRAGMTPDGKLIDPNR